VRNVRAAWIDRSPLGDLSQRLSNGQIPSILSGLASSEKGPTQRYFGVGDVLRDATLSFAAGTHVLIDGVLERCTLELGRGTELVVGASGVLADCNVSGEGTLIVHGAFFERTSPGIAGIARLSVTQSGTVSAAVAQKSTSTRFDFEPGCRLRMKILQAG
jgi:hypothetical protein